MGSGAQRLGTRQPADIARQGMQRLANGKADDLLSATATGQHAKHKNLIGCGRMINREPRRCQGMVEFIAEVCGRVRPASMCRLRWKNLDFCFSCSNHDTPVFQGRKVDKLSGDEALAQALAGWAGVNRSRA